MIIGLSGKGGVGKTTLTAILTDELLRHRPDCRLLVIDADPAMMLAMALDVIPPAWILADIRDGTIQTGDIRTTITAGDVVGRDATGSGPRHHRHAAQSRPWPALTSQTTTH